MLVVSAKGLSRRRVRKLLGIEPEIGGNHGA